MIVAALAGMVATMTPIAVDPQAVEAEIRATRARSNAAIAARDVAGMKAAFLPNAVVLPGASGTPLDMQDFDARIAAAFADPNFLGWVRTPVSVKVAVDGRRAAETGTWVGMWRRPGGTDRRETGVYQAMWVPTPAGWRLKNESFVAL